MSYKRKLINAITTGSMEYTHEVVKGLKDMSLSGLHHFDCSMDELLLKGVEVAASIGKNDTLSMLIAHGVDCSGNDNIAIKKAVIGKNKRSVEIILAQKGVDPQCGENFPLYCSLKNGTDEITSLLLKSGVNPNARRGELFLMAAESGSAEIIGMMLEAGANPSLFEWDSFLAVVRRGDASIVGAYVDKIKSKIPGDKIELAESIALFNDHSDIVSIVKKIV